MFELLSTMGWPAAFAIVASIATTVLGVFGYLRATRPETKESVPITKSSVDSQIQLLHSRLSELKDRVGTVEMEGKLLNQKFGVFQKQITDHEARDMNDFGIVNQKIDKLTELVIKMLQDDKL